MEIIKTVDELFDLSIPTNSSKFTKSFIHNNPGNIPVYGASKDPKEVGYGYVADNLQGIQYFNDCLTWNIDGSSGVVHYRKGRFSLSEKVIPLILKDEWKEVVDIEYLKIMIESAAIREGFSFNNKAGKSRLALLEIPLPAIGGIIDLDAQKAYVNKFHKIYRIKNTLYNYKTLLENSIISMPMDVDYVEVKLSDKVNGESLFELSIGKRVLKKELLDDGIPIYSANVKKPFGYVAESNLDNFDKPSLIWGIDGNFEWNYIEKNVIFATTDHCGRLIVKNELIDSLFLYYQLIEGQSYYGFNRTFRASLDNIGEVSFNIPIDKEGKFDLDTQKKLARKFQKAFDVKNKICNSISSLTEKSIEV